MSTRKKVVLRMILWPLCVGIVMAAVWFVGFQIAKANGDCAANGGEMVTSGTYSITTMVRVGNTLAPMTHTHEIRECAYEYTDESKWIGE